MMKPATTLLAYTYIDLVIAMSRQHQIAEEATSIHKDLFTLDPEWYTNLDDPEAKAALKKAFQKLKGPQPSMPLQYPEELDQ